MSTQERQRSSRKKERSTVALHKDTKRRFDRAKPYDSLSADEFVAVLLDRWEGKR